AAAWHRLQLAWPRLRWTMRAFQNARIEMRFLRARVALALAAAGRPDGLSAASRDAARLARERAPWAHALAALVDASVSATRGRRDDALVRLDAAANVLHETGMEHYAAAARYRRGQLTGGDQGHRLMAGAAAFFDGQSMTNAERIAGLLAPGGFLAC